MKQVDTVSDALDLPLTKIKTLSTFVLKILTLFFPGRVYDYTLRSLIVVPIRLLIFENFSDPHPPVPGPIEIHGFDS